MTHRLAAAGTEAARGYLHTALAIDPTVPAAAQITQRLGVRHGPG